MTENNTALITGEICSPPGMSHSLKGENFYNMTVKVKRLSDVYDYITVTVQENMVPGLEEGKAVTVSGQYRSYNNYSGVGNKLILTLFANEITDKTETENPNTIYLNGFICKQPIYRTTPFGREITDIIVAVNRNFGKSDYIPCIAWGRNAKYAAGLNVGDNIEVWGRIQSRNYKKKITEEEIVEKTAYEVSVTRILLKNTEI